MILDTAFVLDVLDGDGGAIETLKEVDSSRVQQKVSSMTVFELNQGIARADKPESERKRVLQVVESKPVVPADEAVMAKAGRIHGRLKNEGQPIGQSDCIIGATAIVEDEPVLTRNVDHFERIHEVDVRSY